MQEQLYDRRNNQRVKIRKDTLKKLFQSIRQKNMQILEAQDEQTEQQYHKLIDELPGSMPQLLNVLINQNSHQLQLALCSKIDRLVDVLMLGKSNWLDLLYIFRALMVSQREQGKSIAKRTLWICISKYKEQQKISEEFLSYLHVSTKILEKHEISEEEYDSLVGMLSKWLIEKQYSEYLPIVFEIISNLLSLQASNKFIDRQITRNHALIIECFVKHERLLDQLGYLCLSMFQQNNNCFIEPFFYMVNDIATYIHEEHQKMLSTSSIWYCVLLALKSTSATIVQLSLKIVYNFLMCQNVNAVYYASQCRVIDNIVQMIKEVGQGSIEYVCDLVDCLSMYIIRANPSMFISDRILINPDTIEALLFAVKDNEIQYCQITTMWNALDCTRKYLVALVSHDQQCLRAVLQFKAYFQRLTEHEQEEIREVSSEILELLQYHQDHL